MACLGKGHGLIHLCAIAYLADLNCIGGLAQRTFRSIFPVQRINSQFSLVNDGLLVPMNKFNGVLDGDDISTHAAISMINH